MDEYAYEVGYERGWKGGSLYPWPAECPTRGATADALRRGFLAGVGDRKNALAYKTGFVPRASKRE